MRLSSFLAACLLASCAPQRSEPRIEVLSAWARPVLAAGQSSAAYIVLRNSGAKEDRLIGAASEVATKITLHSSSTEAGIARMRPVEDGFAIAAEAVVKLEPGGGHLMLEQVVRPLRAGDTIPIALQFQRSGKRLVQAEVRNGTEDAPPMNHEGH